MPLFECEECHTIDNTALTNFWDVFMKERGKRLCSACDPKIGKWHGRFPKMSVEQYNRENPGDAIDYPARRIGE